MTAKRSPPPGTLAALEESGRTVYVICDGCGCVKTAKLYRIATEAGWRAKIEDVQTPEMPLQASRREIHKRGTDLRQASVRVACVRFDGIGWEIEYRFSYS